MTVQAVMFDVGCVLIDPDDEVLREATRRSVGIDLDPGTARRALARTVWSGSRAPDPEHFWATDTHRHRWAEHAGLPADAGPRVWAELLRLERPLWSVTVPGARATLAALRQQGLRLGAVSNGIGRLDVDLLQHDLLRYFTTTLDSHLERIAKPDARLFRLAADRLDVDLAQCVFVGDDPYFDIGASRQAGVAKAILVDRLQLRPEGWPGPVVRELAELPALISDLAGRQDAIDA